MSKHIMLDDFNDGDLVIELKYKEIIDKYARRCATLLKTASPKTHRPNRTTPYSEGWEVNTHAKKNFYEDVIWNRTNWQLTHLLENGHFITNGYNKNGIVWVSPKKHIKPSYDMIRNPFKREMENMKIDANFK